MSVRLLLGLALVAVLAKRAALGRGRLESEWERDAAFVLGAARNAVFGAARGVWARATRRGQPLHPAWTSWTFEVRLALMRQVATWGAELLHEHGVLLYPAVNRTFARLAAVPTSGSEQAAGS